MSSEQDARLLLIENMWQVRVNPEAYIMVSRYIEAYRDIFLERFTDTGIWSEEVICQGYHNLAEQLRLNIIDTMEHFMSSDRLTGFREEDDLRYIRLTI